MSKENMQAFLHSIDMLASDMDIEQEFARFLKHMQDGLKGVPYPEALQMIPTYLNLNKRITLNEKVIVIDAGGTHFRICLLHFAEGFLPVIEKYQQMRMPGSEGEIGKEEFFTQIAKTVFPYLAESQKLAFCFSYAAEILPSHDGRIIAFSKEVKCPEAEGHLLGEELKKALAKEGYTGELNFLLLNDTVATLIAGYAKSNNRDHSSYVGFILGTGMNAAYVEDNMNIPKLRGKIPLLSTMIINMEAGDYHVDKMSVIDQKVDALSSNPGEHLLEKQISGRYQGRIAYYILEKAMEEEGLFSEDARQKFSSLAMLRGEDLSAFIEEPYGDNPLAEFARCIDDKENIYFILNAIYERAAIYTAILFAAIHEQNGRGASPSKPMAITIEGSAYYQSSILQEKLQYYVKKIVNEEHGFYNDFLQIENANLIGSAIAILLNN